MLIELVLHVMLRVSEVEVNTTFGGRAAQAPCFSQNCVRSFYLDSFMRFNPSWWFRCWNTWPKMFSFNLISTEQLLEIKNKPLRTWTEKILMPVSLDSPGRLGQEPLWSDHQIQKSNLKQSRSMWLVAFPSWAAQKRDTTAIFCILAKAFANTLCVLQNSLTHLRFSH